MAVMFDHGLPSLVYRRSEHSIRVARRSLTRRSLSLRRWLVLVVVILSVTAARLGSGCLCGRRRRNVKSESCVIATGLDGALARRRGTILLGAPETSVPRAVRRTTEHVAKRSMGHSRLDRANLSLVRKTAYVTTIPPLRRPVGDSTGQFRLTVRTERASLEAMMPSTRGQALSGRGPRYRRKPLFRARSSLAARAGQRAGQPGRLLGPRRSAVPRPAPSTTRGYGFRRQAVPMSPPMACSARPLGCSKRRSPPETRWTALTMRYCPIHPIRRGRQGC